jgi:hypothetical protein
VTLTLGNIIVGYNCLKLTAVTATDYIVELNYPNLITGTTVDVGVDEIVYTCSPPDRLDLLTNFGLLTVD